MVLFAVLTVMASSRSLCSHTEEVHALSYQSAAMVDKSMSVVYGKPNPNLSRSGADRLEANGEVWGWPEVRGASKE